ncbi:MAG: LysE family transporter [Candidatus Babeliaceae bacterium]|jgi:threonine/homoserine/homoserine lactone efflux protein
MNLPIFIQGIIIGISLAAPIGPLSIICIRRSLTDRFMASVAVALGAATADALFGFIAIFGVTTISAFLMHHNALLRFVGGLFLGYLGITTLQRTSVTTTSGNKSQFLITIYLSTFILTLTNPLTIVAFGALFTVFGITELVNNYTTALPLISGIFCGSATWFIFLSTFIHLFKNNWKPGTLTLINKISGIGLIVFACIAFMSILKI